MEHILHLYKIYLQHPLVVTDSRKIVPGCLFFALKGDRFNGNEFARQAVEKGAAFAIIDEAAYKVSDQFILVENVLKTLQDLGTHHRRQFHIPVIAITGSNGKTTTKELISSVLSSHYKAHFTKGNFNNHIGVPLTLLAMPPQTEVAIIEMGANHQREIDFLCHLAEPTHGLITNIGKAHLEGFGGIEGVKKGKSELYRYLAKKNGVVFVNLDEPFLQDLSKDVRWKIYYKQSDRPNSHNNPFEIKLLSKTPFIKTVFESNRDAPIIIESQLIGEHNFKNIMTAIVLGIYFKVPDEKIKNAVENYIPTNNRSQIIKIDSNTFILDAYNANPTSMKVALQHLEKLEVPKKIAILGGMKEMGEHCDAEHQAIVDYASSLGLEKLILIGEEFKNTTAAKNIYHFDNVVDLKKWFSQQTFDNTSFLIKGSRSFGLEKLLESSLSE